VTASELASPIPKPRRDVSGKFVALGAFLLIVSVFAIIYGFKRRIDVKEQRKMNQNTVAVSSDSATPPQLRANPFTDPATGRISLDGLKTAPSPTSPETAAGVVQPVKDAVKEIAHPFSTIGTTQTSSSYTPPAAYNPPPYVPPSRDDWQAQTRNRAITRAQQAQEAPTGINTQHTTTSTPSSQIGNIASSFADQMQTIDGYLKPRQDLAAGRIPMGVAAVEAQRAQNAMSDKDQFVQSGDHDGGYLKSTRTAPLSKFVLQRGTKIPATLPQTLVSDLPGDLIAEVQRDVFDSPTGTSVLIKAGSRLVGKYNSHITSGQKRMQVGWTAIYFPDGSFIDLDNMPGHSADGGAGLADQVDNHYKRLIGGVALSSMLAAGLAVSQNHSSGGNVLAYPSAGQQATSAAGAQISSVGAQITSQNLNIQPTLKIRPGEIFEVVVTRDILFPGPYEAKK
jgi:type IV secretory pathway VirB10-like protein